MEAYIRTFRDIRDHDVSAGHKATTLARLHAEGFPVPDGFVVLPSAFVGEELRDEAWMQVQRHLVRLRHDDPGTAFAIRSSAVAEDSLRASFAGVFETVLGVSDEKAIRAAINSVYGSRNAARAQVYQRVRGIEDNTACTNDKSGPVTEMAVIVQRLVRAEQSGVLFTADPVTGDRTRTVGNAIRGLGDKLVSGEAAPMQFELSSRKRLLGILTDVIYDGPPELRRFDRQFYSLGRHLERELGGPQDIEWAIASDRLYVLQARPVTTLVGFDPATGEFNDSLTGDYVWSCVNLGEAVSVVMTPFTWSVMRAGFGELDIMEGHPSVGNIGGRLYQNSTVMISVLHALGKDFVDLAKEMGGVRQEYLETMDQFLEPLPDATFLSVLPQALRVRRREKGALKNAAGFLAENPEWCDKMRQRIRGTHTGSELNALLTAEILPRSVETFWRTYATALQYSGRVGPLRRELVNLAGAADADTLLSNLSASEGMLASLGPMVGLSQVARDELGRRAYIEQWGHRGELETEASAPRPAEDPSWLDRQLASFAEAPVDVEALLADKRAQYSEAWQRLSVQHRVRSRIIKRRLQAASAAAHERESIRSESARIIWVLREWALRAGDITDIGDDVFFLTIDELRQLILGQGAPVETVTARRKTYQRYKSLPPYPLVIRGRFDPFGWVGDPNRDTRFFDSHGLLATLTVDSPNKNIILGVPGSAGSADGLVRRLESPEQGNALQIGEILVASQTNIGWTLFFPRAAAIVTDVGAPLSHAAIVARELGIPAVVNCGDATMRLRTGDRVHVDGTNGTVEILERSLSISRH